MIPYGANISTGACQLGGRMIFLLLMFSITRDNLFIFVFVKIYFIWLEPGIFVLEVRTFGFLISGLSIWSTSVADLRVNLISLRYPVIVIPETQSRFPQHLCLNYICHNNTCHKYFCQNYDKYNWVVWRDIALILKFISVHIGYRD